ncbi:MAG: flagellar hook-length control protein FliK [Pseudomonadota bacterium]
MITIENVNLLPTNAASKDQTAGTGVLPVAGAVDQKAAFRETLQQMVDQSGTAITQLEDPETAPDIAVMLEQPESLPAIAALGGRKLPSEDAAEPDNISNFVAPAAVDGAEMSLQTVQSAADGITRENADVDTDGFDAVGFNVNPNAHFSDGRSSVPPPSKTAVAVAAQIHSDRTVRVNIRELSGPITKPMQRLQAAVDRSNTSDGDGGGRQEWLNSLHASIRNNLLGEGDNAQENKGSADVPDFSVAAETVKNRRFSDGMNEREGVDSGLTHAASRALVREVPAFGPGEVQAAGVSKTGVPVLERPLGHADWNQDLGDRVLWMAGRSMQEADLRLNPPSLGPVEVRISMNQDQASITFSSQHAVVREAIEAAIPKLRDMFGSQQLNLVDVNVSQQSFSDHQRQNDGGGFGHQETTPESAVDSKAEHVFAASVEEEAAAIDNRLLSLYV